MKTIRIEFPLKNSIRLSEVEAVQAMMTGLKKLVEFGAIRGKIDDILHSYEFTDKLGYAIAIVDRDCVVDASKLNSIGASFVYHVDPANVKTTEEEMDKTFSATTIQERLRVNGLNPKIRFRLIIQDYKKYWKSQQTKIKSNPIIARRLKNMFLVDLTGIFSEILPYIQEGKQLNALIGVNQVTDGLTTASKNLSNAYRKALQQSKTGQLSKSIFQGLQVQYSEFLNLLIPQVFPGIEDILKSADTESNKSFSEHQEGIMTVIANDVDQLAALVTEIDKHLAEGDVEVIVNPTKGGKSFKYLNSDFKIHSIDHKQLTQTVESSEAEVEIPRKKFIS